MAQLNCSEAAPWWANAQLWSREMRNIGWVSGRMGQNQFWAMADLQRRHHGDQMTSFYAEFRDLSSAWLYVRHSPANLGVCPNEPGYYIWYNHPGAFQAKKMSFIALSSGLVPLQALLSNPHRSLECRCAAETHISLKRALPLPVSPSLLLPTLM